MTTPAALSRTLALLLAAGAVAAQAAPLQGLDDYVTAEMQKWQIPGLALAVVKDDAVVYARGYGVRELGKDEKVDDRTLFPIASNSKAFTCAALGILVDEGKLKWDDKVGEILPWFHLHDDFATADLRVIDLVTHRVGLPTFGGDHLWIGSEMPRAEVLRRIRYQKLTGTFRGCFQYQNILYTAAGEVIPRRTGKSWTEFVQEHLLGPLGMRDSNTSVGDLAGADNVATPHEVRGGKLVTMPFDNVDSIKAAAGINSSARDMTAWLRMHLAGGALGQTRVLTARNVHEMQQVANPLAVSAGRTRVLGTHFRGYGLGWFTEDYAGHKVVSHGGALTGMISQTTLVPELRLGVVVLTNMAENSLPVALGSWIIDRYLDRPRRDWSALYLGFAERAKEQATAAEKKLQDGRLKDTSPSLLLSAYAGTYHNPLPGDATVRLEDGRLYFHYNRRHHGYLTHWQHDTFRIEWLDCIMDMEPRAFVRFELDESSQVIKLHTKWYHPITFDRVRR